MSHRRIIDSNLPVGVVVSWSGRGNGPGWVEDATSGCHIWFGAKSPNGYGKVGINGRTLLVHRVRYEREIGPIPAGLMLDHFACDNGHNGCVNPRHCRPVTPRENALRSRSVAAAARARTHCPAGHTLADDNLVAWLADKHGIRKCRTCDIARSARYHATNREAALSRRHEWYRAHRDEINAARRLTLPARRMARTPDEVAKSRAYQHDYHVRRGKALREARKESRGVD